MFGPRNANEEQVLSNLFAIARKMFEVDGYHQLMFFLLSGRKMVRCFAIQPEMTSVSKQKIVGGGVGDTCS